MIISANLNPAAEQALEALKAKYETANASYVIRIALISARNSLKGIEQTKKRRPHK